MIERQRSHGAGGKRARHDRRAGVGIVLIDRESGEVVVDVAVVIGPVHGWIEVDVQLLRRRSICSFEFRERHRSGRGDVGGDDRDFCHHIAVVIRVHLPDVHGAAVAQVHGLHELDIVVVGRAFDCDGGLAVLDGEGVFSFGAVCSVRRSRATETVVGVRCHRSPPRRWPSALVPAALVSAATCAALFNLVWAAMTM